MPSERTITLSGSSSPANSSACDSGITQQPAFLPSVSRRTAPLCLRRPKAMLEEVEAQDVALAGQQVVGDAEPAHRREVAARRSGAPPAGPSRRARPAPVSSSWSVSRRSALPLRVLLVPAADLAVEVPAVVVERARGSPPPRRRQAAQVDEARPRRRRAGRRCRRCSSGPRPGSRGARATRPRTSPSTALRRWPMCAALLGLMLVCSMTTLPPRTRAVDQRRVEQRRRRRRARSRKKLR